MTSGKPTRSTVGGRVYLDLQNLARRQGRPTDELLQTYALEGLLARIVASKYSSSFVLKGGVLLAALGARRPTRDIDVQAQDIQIEAAESVAITKEIIAIPIDDGLSFDADSVAAETIRNKDEYNGVRVSIAGSLATARLSLHIDISTGDPVTPPPGLVDLPRLLGGSITLLGYPLVMVLAEKIVTAMQRGAANTRWRDFADIYTLIHDHPVSGHALANAIEAVANYRGMDLVPMSITLRGYSAIAGTRWSTWRRKQQHRDQLPEDFSEVLAAIITFADRVLTRLEAAPQSWDPANLTWG